MRKPKLTRTRLRELSLRPYPGVVFVTRDRKAFERAAKELFNRDERQPESTQAGRFVAGPCWFHPYTALVWWTKPETLAHELAHVILDLFENIRIDNNGDYCPENCRWATKKEQSRNTRTNKLLVYKGETRCLAEWVDIIGIPRVTIRTRLRLGWTVEQAFETPVRKR